jgi:hypothetical protein
VRNGCHANGLDEELRIARITAKGEISQRAIVVKGGLAPWPSNHPALARVGKEA